MRRSEVQGYQTTRDKLKMKMRPYTGTKDDLVKINKNIKDDYVDNC